MKKILSNKKETLEKQIWSDEGICFIKLVENLWKLIKLKCGDNNMKETKECIRVIMKTVFLWEKVLY